MTNALLILNNEWTSGQLFQMRGCLHPSLLFLQPVLICPNSWWDDLQYKLRIGFWLTGVFPNWKATWPHTEQKRVPGNLALLGEWSSWWVSPASGCTTVRFVALHVFILSALVLSATKKGQSQGLGVWNNQWQWQGSVINKKGQGTLVLRRMRETARLSGT